MFLLPTHNGQPLPLLRENEKLCIILSSYFVKLINTTVRHPIIPKQYVRSDVLQSPNAWGQQPPRVEYTHNEHWGCANPKQRVLCKQNIQCPIPFPLPLFSPCAGQLLSSLHMGEKRGRGKGMGQCCCCPHTMGSPCQC